MSIWDRAHSRGSSFTSREGRCMSLSLWEGLLVVVDSEGTKRVAVEGPAGRDVSVYVDKAGEGVTVEQGVI